VGGFQPGQQKVGMSIVFKSPQTIALSPFTNATVFAGDSQEPGLVWFFKP
jgi:hypothetical protein